MTRYLVYCVAAVCVLLTGCVSSKQKAHELSEQAVYKPITYENASVSGCEVVVLPCSIKSRHYAFVQQLATNNIRDFVELELTNANFKVLERAETQQFFDEIALAANLGDASALKAFKKGRFKTANWFVVFDVIKAEQTIDITKSFDGQTLGAIVELGFLLAGKDSKNALGKSLGTAISSVKSAESLQTWTVGMGYKVINASTGEVLFSGEVEDKMEVHMKMGSVMGSTEKTTQITTLDTMVQRLVQKGVYEIDKAHKNDPADQPDPKAKTKAEAKVDPKVAAAYKKKVEELKLQQDKDDAIAAVKLSEDAFAQFDKQASAGYFCPQLVEKYFKHPDIVTWYKIAEDTPNWRKQLSIDMSGVSYTLTEYTPEKAKVQASGVIKVTSGKDTKESAVSDANWYGLVKENGVWKVCSAVAGKDRLTPDAPAAQQ